MKKLLFILIVLLSFIDSRGQAIVKNLTVNRSDSSSPYIGRVLMYAVKPTGTIEIYLVDTVTGDKLVFTLDSSKSRIASNQKLVFDAPQITMPQILGTSSLQNTRLVTVGEDAQLSSSASGTCILTCDQVMDSIAAHSSGSAWSLTGNSETDSVVNFVGTTDDKPLVFKVNNLFSGIVCTNTSGYNTYLGYHGGNNPTGGGNTAVGYQAGTSLSGVGFTGSNNNTAIGVSTLLQNADGEGNTAVGGAAASPLVTGNRNTIIGFQGGGIPDPQRYGQNECTLIGFNTKTLRDSLTNASAFGAGAKVSQSNTIVLGDSAANSNLGTDVAIGSSYALARLDVRGNAATVGNQIITDDPSGIFFAQTFLAVTPMNDATTALFNLRGTDGIGGYFNGLFVLNGANPYVGIGTVNPPERLSVIGRTWITDKDGGSPLGTAYLNVTVFEDTVTDLAVIKGMQSYAGTTPFKITNGTNPNVLLDEFTSMGIGTATPAARLDVVGDFNQAYNDGNDFNTTTKIGQEIEFNSFRLTGGQSKTRLYLSQGNASLKCRTNDDSTVVDISATTFSITGTTGNIILDIPSKGESKILTSDASGNATWQSAGNSMDAIPDFATNAAALLFFGSTGKTYYDSTLNIYTRTQ